MPKLSVSLPDEIVTQIDDAPWYREDGDAVNRSRTISEIVGRYEEMRKRCLPELTDSETNCVLDACNGYMSWGYPPPRGALLGQLSAAFRYDRMDEKWNLDGTALLAKIEAGGYAAEVALLDMAERYWDGVRRNRQRLTVPT